MWALRRTRNWEADKRSTIAIDVIRIPLLTLLSTNTYHSINLIKIVHIHIYIIYYIRYIILDINRVVYKKSIIFVCILRKLKVARVENSYGDIGLFPCLLLTSIQSLVLGRKHDTSGTGGAGCLWTCLQESLARSVLNDNFMQTRKT